MQKLEDVEGHGNVPVTKEVNGVEEENMKPNESMTKLMVYLRQSLLAEKCDDTQMTEKERTRWEMKRKIYAVDALGMLFIGLLISYAPQYIQANIPWITIGTEIFSLLCFAGSIKVFSDAYPHLFTRENIMLAVLSPGAIILYLSSEPGKSYMNVPLSALSQQDNVVINYRIMSFIALVSVIIILQTRIPDLFLFYEHRKGKLRAIIVSKKSVALILGALSVGTAMGTALLTLIQVVSGLLHF